MHGVLDMCNNNLSLGKLNTRLPLVMGGNYPGLYATSHFVLQSSSNTTTNKNSDELQTLSNSSAFKFLTHPSHSGSLVIADSWENNNFLRTVSKYKNQSTLWLVRSHCTLTTTSSCLCTLCSQFVLVTITPSLLKKIINKVIPANCNSFSNCSFNGIYIFIVIYIALYLW